MTLEPAFLVGQSIAIIGMAIAAYFNIYGRVTKLEVLNKEGIPDRVTKLEAMVKDGLSERVTLIEATLRAISEKATTILHSPHDPYGLDSLLESYVDNHHDLTDSEWRELFAKCQEVQNDVKVNTDVRMLAMLVETLAGFTRELAAHKLSARERK